MYKQLGSKKSGSALLMALIFAFVIMVMLTGLLYTFKMGLLTSKSIIKNSHEKILGETYISKAKDDIDFTKPSEFKMGDTKFEIAVDEDNISLFFPKNTNAELFHSQEYNSYDAIYKAFNLGSKVNLTERIIYNALGSNSYQNFDGDYTPINVPMISPDNMQDYQERNYRLKNDGTIEDIHKGFIGFIQKQNKQLNLFTEKAKISIPIPDAMGTDYKIKVGWNLEKGKWYLYLLLYDTDKLFTSVFPLDDILNEDVKKLAKDNEALGNEIGKWKAVIEGSGNGGSSGGQFIKANVLGVVWYFENNDGPPQLMLVRKADQKKGKRDVLEIYYSVYSSINKNYTFKLAGKLDFKTELKEKNIKLLVPDPANNFDASMVLIFHPNNQSDTIMGISDFNYNGDHRVGKSLDTYIDGDSFGKPIIASRSDNSMYVITYEPNKIHRYIYEEGYGSFISTNSGSNGIEREFKDEDDSDNVVVGLSDSKDKDDDENKNGIQLVIPKFGYLFVFTANKVMQLNYDLDILQEFDLETVSAPQILVDFDAVKNTINKIYIQSDGLDIKAKEIRDELDDEDEPKDKNEIDDKSKEKATPKVKTTKERRLEEIAKNNKDGEDEEEPAEPVYLDSKYLYPLGVVKKVVI